MGVKLNPSLSIRPQAEGVSELGVEKDIWALEGRRKWRKLDIAKREVSLLEILHNYSVMIKWAKYVARMKDTGNLKETDRLELA
jgi:hypothetical protein